MYIYMSLGSHGSCSSLVVQRFLIAIDINKTHFLALQWVTISRWSKGSLAFASTFSQWPMVFAEPGPLTDETKDMSI